MDHLYHSKNQSIHHPVEFPLVYRREIKYEGGDFFQYYATTACDCGATDHGPKTLIYDIPHHADMIQCWLFFGVLHEFSLTLRVAFRMEDFVQEGRDGQKFITTRNLPRYIWYWAASKAHANPDKQATLVRKESIDLILDHMRTMANMLTDHEESDQESAVGHPVLIPISILGSTLDSVNPVLFKTAPGTWNIPLALRRLVNQAGWCHSEIEALTLAQFTPPSLYLLALHPKGPDGKDHSRCSKSKCVACQLDETMYHTAHATINCKCGHVVQQGIECRVNEILKSGGIPACVLITSNGSGQCSSFDVKVVDTSSIPTYVAIPHVWSDGMGNTKGNTLPLCLWEYLQNRAQRLYPQHPGPVPFWIDTICVPRERTMRDKAIRGLMRVYQAAEKVLVIDKSIQCLSLATSSPFELLFRMAVSP